MIPKGYGKERGKEVKERELGKVKGKSKEWEVKRKGKNRRKGKREK